MSLYPNVTEQDLTTLSKLAEQQKKQGGIKIKNRFLEQIHDNKLAESLSPIAKKIEEVDKSTEKLREIIKESNSRIDDFQDILPLEIDLDDDDIQSNIGSLPTSNEFSSTMMKTLGSLMNSENSLK